MEKEIEQIPGRKVSKWLGPVFIIFCIATAVFAIYTVNADGDAPIEYDVSSKTVDNDKYGGKKEIFWRVKSTEVPRWKKFANRWHLIKGVDIFWESKSGYTRGDEKSYILSHQNCEWKTEHTVEEFKQIRDSCQTVKQIREYQKKQREIYKYNKRSAVERRQKKAANTRTKNIWDEALTTAADDDNN